MPSPSRIALRSLPLALVVMAVAFCAEPAAAHKINVFAYVEGSTLRGEVYARGGEPIRGAKVEVLDAAGEKLGETTTDDEGEFTFQARFRCDHQLVVDAGAGHGAEYTLSADELPDGLPARGGGAPSTSVPDAAADVPASEDIDLGSGDESIREEVAGLHRQVVQLRRELSEYQEKMRFKDVLGAVGYILGLMGVAFYFLGVRKRDGSLGS